MKFTFAGVMTGLGLMITCPIWIPALILGGLVKLMVIAFMSGYNAINSE